MDALCLLNKGQFTANFIFRQMTNHTLKPSRPGFEQHMNTVKTRVPRFFPEFRQYLVTGVSPVTEDIHIRLTVRHTGDFGHSIQPAGVNGVFDVVITRIARGTRVIRIRT